MPSFRQLTGTVGVDWTDLNYRDWCVAQNAMKHTADAMASVGLNVSSVAVPGLAGPLRIAEGVDSINNIVNSANAETTSAASGFLICSITQAGGLLYFFMVLCIVSVLLVVIPFFNFLSELVFDAGCVIVASAARNNTMEEDARTAQHTQQHTQVAPPEVPLVRSAPPEVQIPSTTKEAWQWNLYR